MSVDTTTALQIVSPSFKNDHIMSSRFTCEGENINPALVLTNVPPETVSLALLMEDPDAPKGIFVHWVMWSIKPVSLIDENSAPGIQGVNSRGSNQYIGPCPPYGTHRYHFNIFALDTKLELPRSAGKAEMMEAMSGHIISQARITGLYKRIVQEPED